MPIVSASEGKLAIRGNREPALTEAEFRAVCRSHLEGCRKAVNASAQAAGRDMQVLAGECIYQLQDVSKLFTSS